MGVPYTSHFAVPKGTAVWLATIVQCLRHFFHCNSIPNLSTFPIAKYTIYQYFPLQNIPSINISHYNSFPLYRHSPLHLISNLSAFPIATNPQSIPFPSISSVGNRGCIRKMSGGGNPPDIHCYSFTSLPDCFGRVTVISHSLQDHCNGYRLPCT